MDTQKVVIMGDSYGLFGFKFTLVICLLSPLSEIVSKCKVISGLTNLCNIVQNPDEWVTILEPDHHVIFSINSHKKTTYFRSI